MTTSTRLIGMMALVLLAACGSDDEGSTPGSAGSAGSSGSAGAAGTSGASGAAGTSGAAGAAGDARAQAALFAREDLACTQDADCCVVFDMCVNEGYLVAAKDKDAVKGLLDSAPDDMCTNCIPPAIQVSCGASGFCVAGKIECTSSTFLQEGMADHCGKLTLPSDCSVKTQTVDWDPGLQTQTILGCGD